VSAGLRIGVVGATGALGSEVLGILAESSLQVDELVAVATERSLGRDLDFRDQILPVVTEAPRLRGLDLLVLCAPAEVSADYAREALRAEVPCIDVSGSLASSREVTLQVAGFGTPEAGEAGPLLVAPPGAALPWAMVLRPLHHAAGLRRVVGTALEGASAGGRDGIESLLQESIALFNQEELPKPSAFRRPVAFDCLPTLGEVGEGGATDRDRAVVDALRRLLDPAVGFAITSVQVPTFAGFGGIATLETERPLEPKQAEDLLARAPGVEVWGDDADGLTLRAAAGREEVWVARLRSDPTVEHGLQLWIAADVLRVAAANAVRLAVARLRRHH
jgi:aspartate-semialdehyde dehydrogenase